MLHSGRRDRDGIFRAKRGECSARVRAMPNELDENSTVEVTIRSTDGDHELLISVPVTCKIKDCRRALADQHDKPEALEEGARFVKFMPNGATAPIGDSTKLGSRRVLVIEGVSLKLAEVALMLGSLDDFDEYDPHAEVASPRSLQACYAEGIRPEELNYVPLDHFKDQGVSKSLQRMRHDFFECYRQDVLKMSRQLRYRLMDEEDTDFDGGGQGATSSSCDANGSLVAAGGIWAGPLEQATYPSVQMYFTAMNEHTTAPRGGKLYDRPLKLPEQEPKDTKYCYSTALWKAPDGRPDRYAQPTPKPFEGESDFEVILDNSSGNFKTGLKFIRDHGYIRVTFVKDSGLGAAWNKRHPTRAIQEGDVIMKVNNAIGKKIIDEIRDDKLLKIQIKRKDYVPGHDIRGLARKGEHASYGAEKVQNMVEELKGLDFGGGGGEQAIGAILRTESNAGGQRRGNSIRLDGLHKEARWTCSRKITMAGAAKDKMELELADRLESKRVIDEYHMVNGRDFTKGVQAENFHKAVARSDQWNERRQAIAAQALAAERERNAKTTSLLEAELKRTKKTANMRDLQKISYARRWLDRRTRWSHSHKEVRTAVSNWNKGTLERHTEAAARLEDQTLRTMKWVDVVREIKSLRRDFQEMIQEREKRRQAFRRISIGQGLRQMAIEAEKLQNEVEAEAEVAPMDDEILQEPWKPWKGISRHSDTPMLASTISGISTQDFGQLSMMNSTQSPSSSKSFKHPGLPRFAFPRIETAVMSPMGSTMGSMSMASLGGSQSFSMSQSASAPGLIGGRSRAVAVA